MGGIHVHVEKKVVESLCMATEKEEAIEERCGHY